MVRPSTRTRRAAKVVAVPVALLASAALVWQGSYAAFTDTTSTDANTWSAGQVDLTDDDAGAAAFAVTNMVPGATGTKCVTVTSHGSVPGVVKLYSASKTDTNGLGAYLRLTVERGTGGSFASCTGFTSEQTVLSNVTLNSFATANTGYATGAGSWSAAGVVSPAVESKTYRFTYTLDAATPNTAQGGTAGVNFVWEIQTS